LYYGWRDRPRQAVARASWLDRWRNWGTVSTLGVVTTVLYLATGSLWVVTGFHWAVLADEPVIYPRPKTRPTE
ncbi:MAG: hypothetical protein AAF283_04755, partial [Cyanobacteria bacterium P01_A01_bin.70]